MIQSGRGIDDYEIILYTHLFTHELDFPSLHIEIKEDSFILHVLPDDLKVSHLKIIDDLFDKFELVFLKNSRKNLLRIKFIM